MPQKFLLSYREISQDYFSQENGTILLSKFISKWVNSPNAEILLPTKLGPKEKGKMLLSKEKVSLKMISSLLKSPP